MHRWIALYSVALAALLTPLTSTEAHAEPGEPERLLIFDFKATDEGDALLAQTTQRFLVDSLSEMDTYDLIQKADMVRLLKLTEERQQLGCADSTCAAEYGKLLDAGLYIRGDLARIGGKPVLTLQLFSVKAARIDAQQSVTLKGIDHLATQMRSETYKLMNRSLPAAAWYKRPLTWTLIGLGVSAVAAGVVALTYEPDPIYKDPKIVTPPDDGTLGTITFGLESAPGGLQWRW